MPLRYLFTGNRIAVLNEMVRLCLNVSIYPIMNNKKEFIKGITRRRFDVFVSNGCPYILPISKIKKKHQIFINVHPSLLPDLRGISPIVGAIKYNRPMGATCHYMDDGIDTGLVISQVRFEPKDRNDLGDCYKQSYKAEAKVFNLAYRRHFKPLLKQPKCKNPIYYSK